MEGRERYYLALMTPGYLQLCNSAMVHLCTKVNSKMTHFNNDLIQVYNESLIGQKFTINIHDIMEHTKTYYIK